MQNIGEFGIEELELNVRAYNVLKRMRINTISELRALTVEDLHASEYGLQLGLPSFRNIVEALNKL